MKWIWEMGNADGWECKNPWGVGWKGVSWREGSWNQLNDISVSCVKKEKKNTSYIQRILSTEKLETHTLGVDKRHSHHVQTICIDRESVLCLCQAVHSGCLNKNRYMYALFFMRKRILEWHKIRGISKGRCIFSSNLRVWVITYG